MIGITPRAKWERMVCVTTLAEEREWWEMCRGTNPNHADRNFLVAPSSLPWRTPHSPLMRTLGLSFELKECCCTSVGGRKHGRHWIGKWFSANALRALIHNLRRNCKILHATHILFSILRTLPKAQRTRGLSSACQSNLFRSYHKLLHKSWSNFIFRISTRHQLQNINQTSDDQHFKGSFWAFFWPQKSDF